MIRTRNVMANANLGTAQAAEIPFHLMVQAPLRPLMVDALHFETLMQAVPRSASPA
jgi:hypothetical protein